MYSADKPISKVLCLLPRPDELNDSVEHLLILTALLFLKNKHEVMAEASLHHHPVDCTSKVYVGRQKHYVFACTVSQWMSKTMV